jgi:uncharacterized protein DUF4157
MHQMMRSAAGKLSTPVRKGMHPQAFSATLQKRRPANEREGESNRFESEVGVSEVSPEIEGTVRSAVGSGRQMPAHLLDFFEPRLGRELSQVRLHTDQSAAATSQSLQAAAFTFGSDIFFNAGRFSPETATGFGLLSHELAHVAQQHPGGVSRRLIQRAILPYHQLIWEDFKATAPKDAKESAGLLSSFEVPNPVLTSGTTDTKKPCKLDKPIGRKKTDTTFEGKGSADPVQFDGKFQPYMDTDRSWLKDRYKDDGTAYCTGQITQCESAFDAQATKVKTSCEGLVAQCEAHFKSSKKEIRLPLGDRKITISNTDQCRPMILNKCQQIDMSSFSVSTAKTKAECKTNFFRQCLSDETSGKASLLKHEQGHFEITRVMADKARDDIRTRAATLQFTGTGCGLDAATAAVKQAFEQPKNELVQLGEAWRTLKNQVQDDYDVETTNGSDQAKQVKWEGIIKAKLKTYVLPAAIQPAPAQATPPQPSTTPAPTGAPVTPAPAPKK